MVTLTGIGVNSFSRGDKIMSVLSGAAGIAVCSNSGEVLRSLLPAGSSLESIDLDCSTPSGVPPYAAVLARTISEEAPDPRIQVELERLNTSTDTINKLEVELDEARLVFRQLLADSTQRIDALSKKLGKCVQQARPYYEARIKAKQALQETQTACLQFERAVSEHTAAREMVFLAEEGLMQSGAAFDHTWQEMLNHASAKVNAAESAKHECGNVHQRVSVQYQEAEARVQQLQQQLKRAIARSSLNTRRSLLQISNIVRMQQLHLLPYFEAKSQVNQQLEWQKQRIRRLEVQVGEAKGTYAAALDALETISDQIHKSRQSKLELGVRGVGVGAESPSYQLSSEQNCSPHTKSSTSHFSAAVDNAPAAVHALHHPAPTSVQATGQYTPVTVKADDLASEIDASEEPVIVASCASVLQASCEGLSKSSTESKGPLEQQQLCGSASSSLGGDLSGWQLVGAEASSGGAGSLSLTVEDASMSDSESLASMEMLSDEAIAGLMLEDELSEASQPVATHAHEAERRSHAPCLPPPADGAAKTATATEDVTGVDIDLLRQLSRSYSEAPLTADRLLSSAVFGQTAPSCGLLNSALQQSGVALSSTNPFTSTNPFLSDLTVAPFASSEELLSKIDSVIRSAKSDNDDNLDSNPFAAANTAAVVETANSNADLGKDLIDDCISSVDRQALSPVDIETRVPNTTVNSSTSLSPSRSPVNRPCSLPLTSLNNPARRGVPPSSIYVPVVSSTSASSHRPESVVVTSDSSSGSSVGHHHSNSDAEGITRSSSAVSAGAWTPKFSTPAYAPLQDALESPALGPPPDYPPPLYPPPLPPRIKHSSTPSPE